MKKPALILIAAVLLLVSGFFLWRSRPSGDPSHADTSSKRERAPTPAQTTNPEARTSAQGRTTPSRPSNDVVAARANLSPSELIQSAVNQANQPISFYGKVVDQSDAPIPGARVRVEYREHRLSAPGTATSVTQRADKITDASGRFEITGANGDHLTIQEINKAGYELSPKSIRNYSYEARDTFRPDRNLPVIFRMWKRHGADRLIVHDRVFSGIGIPVDGTPTTFDLFEGRKNSGIPDLKVTLTRTPLHVQPRTPFDWGVILEMPSGGLVPLDDDLPFEAPEGDYPNSFRFEASKEDPDWPPKWEKEFYIKTRGKFFGRVTIQVNAFWEPPPTGISITSMINPKGSRNLEYDPRQGISSEDHFPPNSK